MNYYNPIKRKFVLRENEENEVRDAMSRDSFLSLYTLFQRSIPSADEGMDSHASFFPT